MNFKPLNLCLCHVNFTPSNFEFPLLLVGSLATCPFVGYCFSLLIFFAYSFRTGYYILGPLRLTKERYPLTVSQRPESPSNNSVSRRSTTEHFQPRSYHANGTTITTIGLGSPYVVTDNGHRGIPRNRRRISSSFSPALAHPRFMSLVAELRRGVRPHPYCDLNSAAAPAISPIFNLQQQSPWSRLLTR